MDLHREVLTAAERTAHPREVDAHLLLLEPEARGDLVAVDVQPLRRDVDIDATLAVGHREPGLRAEKRLILDPDLVHARDGHVSVRVRIAVTDDERAYDVRPRVVAIPVSHRGPIRMQRLLLCRALCIRDGLERLV